MRSFNATDRRAIVAATGLLVLGTVVRIGLAPDAAEVQWRPAGADRTAEELSHVRRDVNQALKREAESDRPLALHERIDINRADESALRRLPGVGRSRAAAILRERSVRGPFHSPQDLMHVPGIGEGLAERISPHIDYGSGAENFPKSPASRGIDLNRAQIKELEQITGIGPAIAARITDYRARNGRFETVEGLLDVVGIGPKMLEVLRDEVYVR